VRSLRMDYLVEGKNTSSGYLYIYQGVRTKPNVAKPINKTARARILHLCGYRCQMCGRTPADDQIKLHVDHKIPQEWGGNSEDDNLWALCSECNEGKKNFFATITDPAVRHAILYKEIWVRIGELLKAKEGEFIPKKLFQIVAYTHDDWEKRMRELRRLGWEYDFRKFVEDGRTRVEFRLLKWYPWPNDVPGTIRRLDKEFRQHNRQLGNSEEDID
jgi:hypothetical protein